MTLYAASFPDPHPASPGLPPAPAAPPVRRGETTLRLAMRHAGERDVAVRYQCMGDPALPVVLVAGGISADRHLAAGPGTPGAGWWDAQVGAGHALDPASYRLVSIDWIGGDGRLDAPIDPADQADAIAGLLDHLGIDCVHAFVGCSYGAMVGLQFAALHGRRLRRLVAISGTHRAHPWASAWRALQRRAVELGSLQCDAANGLSLARQMAMLGYRTPAEFARRFGAAVVAGGRVRVDAEEYLDHCGNRYVGTTRPVAFLRLSESIDLQQLDPRGIRVPVTVVAIQEDQLVPLDDALALVQQLGGDASLRVLRSLHGHDAFLVEHEAIARVLAEALAEPEVAA